MSTTPSGNLSSSLQPGDLPGTPPRPDGSDGSQPLSPQSQIAGMIGPGSDTAVHDGSNPADEAVDPIEQMHGPLVRLEGNGAKVQLNEPALAVKLSQEHGLSYSPTRGLFFRFDPQKGIHVELLEAEAVWECVEFLKKISDRLQLPKILPMRNGALAKRILSLVQGRAPLGTPPGPERKLLPVLNGVLDLSGEKAVLRPYERDDWFTHQIPIHYNPEASRRRFEEELILPALPAEGDRLTLKRALGAMLVPGNRAQRVVFLYGEGGSGKSVLVSVVERVLGRVRVAHLRTDQLGTRFETHAYHGKSLLVGKDVDPNYLKVNGARALKSLTGGDLVQTEKKYGAKYELEGNFHVIITSNAPLEIVADDNVSAWSRRMLPFEFSRNRPEKIIPGLDQQLATEEGEGILAYLVEGFMEHQKELSDRGDFELNPPQKHRIDDLVLRSRSVEHFLSTEIRLGKGKLTTEEIHEAYLGYCERHKWKPVSERSFQVKLSEEMPKIHGVRKRHDVTKNHKAQNGFCGVVFASSDTPALVPKPPASLEVSTV